MPWNPAQTRLFLAAAHNPEIAKKHGLSQGKAREMAMETPAAGRSAAMRGARAKGQVEALRR